MDLINEKVILAYGLTGEDEERFNDLLVKQNILPCRVIEKNMGSVTIREVLRDIKKIESNSELPNEKLLIFSNFADKELYELIDDIRQIKSSDTILAAVTPTSINWTVSYLMHHLIAEREAYKKSK
ncbi:DUF3783 domain-containing protein [Clostridium estertheticum]|uniref:DUF3783 domain-containing protein n=1 Tax=Clostridium estertheticum TaxID=238834 RepID=A0A7Y3T0Q5_9CLOT|nr:DUF3783 domain-containing protein [Clostridium estertheticum]MBW9172968.1 DUF3783 domain-containing protein [Clostridium estertheticum]MBX4261756.1 DUF3783 domain-containing protein [Clostridium estertheticum]NNU77977.1 DUF3783 domain-containing protein [Clostridium estertheticum]WBL47559.1 DUF3783 domain-containing protein [Clostridium estertheticum]WLC70106.1 DUF3783 domain-containing protein [Clostridium estertheticum]